MDYKEKYEQALERARQFSEKPYLEDSAGIVEYIFPELKESEDERIRKHIIGVLRDHFSGEDTDKCIAWLEKVGEIIKEWSEMKVANIQRELQEMVDFKQKTEQGEQKSADKIQLGKKYKCIASPRYSTFRIGEIYKPEDKFLCSLMNFCSDCFEPIEDEQKPADKVEPKFKVGDWVTNGRYTRFIVGINSDCSYYMFKDGTSKRIKDIDKKYYLWTIQDAKDGDVLAYRGEQWIFIYKERRKDETLIEYYALTSEKGLTINNVALTVLLSCIVPATKEQRDLLFQKMKEAGYVWDSEKKELRKIEQKPAYTKEYDFHGIKFIPKFAKGDIIKDKKCGEVSTIEDFSYDTGLYTHTYGQFPITIQDNYEIIAQKPAWSKEDEKIIRRIDSLLYSQCKIHGSEYEEIHNWLKFISLQNRWKPSESDILLLERIANGESNPQDFQASLGGLIGQLKKLREE